MITTNIWELRIKFEVGRMFEVESHLGRVVHALGTNANTTNIEPASCPVPPIQEKAKQQINPIHLFASRPSLATIIKITHIRCALRALWRACWPRWSHPFQRPRWRTNSMLMRKRAFMPMWRRRMSRWPFTLLYVRLLYLNSQFEL